MTQPDYVFIVGLHRTGTALVRSILNRSAEVGISMGESHFLGSRRFFGLLTRAGFRQMLESMGDISTQSGTNNIAAFLFDNPQNNFWRSIPDSLSREDFLRRLLASEDRYRALFEMAMIFGANGKPVRGEKTPAHIHHVPTLMEWFPKAKIIHTFRDPRAIYVSFKKKRERRKPTSPRKSFRQMGLIYDLYESLEHAVIWRGAIRLHQRYERLYANSYHLCKYEDLVCHPKSSIKQLCDFLRIDFSEAMLEQTVVNSSFVSRTAQVPGFDKLAINRWRTNLHPVICRWLNFWCKPQLLEFGYQL